MKSPLSSILLCLVSSFSALQAQEAWLLEMPNKYSDYLIKKSIAGEYDTVDGIVEKIPGLIAAKQVREIELVKWEAEGGKINKKKKVTHGTRSVNSGARYYSAKGDTLELRKITVTPASATGRIFKIDTAGFIPRSWTPTFIQKGEKLTIVLLERHAESNTATVSLNHSRQLGYDTGPVKQLVAWYSSDSLDAKKLSYESNVALIANPQIKFGTKIFTSVNKGGETLMRVEAHSQDPKTQDSVVLHHNEIKFSGHSETSGPLKMETIKIADKSFTPGEGKGAWTLALTSGE